MNSSAGRRALVVGAGIGGLTAALALSRVGWQVTVLPVGLQIVGARHDDARVLRAARAYERASGELFARPVDNPRGAR